ncbi:MAG: SpoIIE family protein phosphatase [Rubrivivax sp.]|nr:SpoIIE family protein phosphatase [Rubrivivax sp.]
MPAPTAMPRLSSTDLESLLGVTRHLAMPFELSAMLAEVAAAACRVLRAERASVWLLDVAAQELVLEVSSDIVQVRIPVGHGLVGACATDRQAINVPDCYADPRFDPSVDRQSGFHTRCSLTLPLADLEGGLVGVLQVLNKRGSAFAAGDQALAEALAAQCAVALARARSTARLLEAAKLRQELALARTVQLGSLPRSWPALPGYDMHATFLPAAETGGDTYDLALVDGQLLVVLADATGHGIAPALSVTQMQAMLRMAFRLGAPLERVFREVNDRLCECLPDGHFVTAFVGLLDPDTHRLRFISGGQGSILHYAAADDAFRVHKAGTLPMGLRPVIGELVPVALDLAPGDLLVLVSDGVFEYEDRHGVAFGRGRVEQAVRAGRGDGPAALSRRLGQALQHFAAGAPQEDDITMVVLGRQALA